MNRAERRHPPQKPSSPRPSPLPEDLPPATLSLGLFNGILGVETARGHIPIPRSAEGMETLYLLAARQAAKAAGVYRTTRLEPIDQIPFLAGRAPPQHPRAIRHYNSQGRELTLDSLD